MSVFFEFQFDVEATDRIRNLCQVEGATVAADQSWLPTHIFTTDCEVFPPGRHGPYDVPVLPLLTRFDAALHVLHANPRGVSFLAGDDSFRMWLDDSVVISTGSRSQAGCGETMAAWLSGLDEAVELVRHWIYTQLPCLLDDSNVASWLAIRDFSNAIESLGLLAFEPDV
jgi:hypothetical protein